MESYSLSGNERIRRKKDFEKVYNSSKALISTNLLIKALYFSEESKEKGFVKIAAAVSSKAGKAVWRNRTKRLIKEAYRKNKQTLLLRAVQKRINILVVFSPHRLSEKKNRKPALSEISESIKELIFKISHQI